MGWECSVLTALLLRETVERVIALTGGTNEAGEREVDRLAGDDTAVLVNLTNGDLNGSVVLGLDKAAGRSALARNVKVNKVTL